MQGRRLISLWMGIGMVSLCLGMAGVSGAQEFDLDFEVFPGPDGIFGTVDDVPAPDCPGDGPFQICGDLGGVYESAGITFAPVLLFQGPHFPDAADDNHFLSSEPLDATFDFDVFQVSLQSFSVWTAVLYALDEGGTVIATDTLTNLGGGFELGQLSISSTEAIRRVVALPDTCVLDGGFCSEILNVDNFSISTVQPAPAVVEVPTLSKSAIILLTALLSLSGWWLLRSRRS